MRALAVCPIVFALSLVPMAAFLAAQAPPGPPELPPPRGIPGITADDPHPRGCVDCHVEIPEMKLDVRLSTLVAGWTKMVPPALLAKAQASAPEGMTLRGRHPALPSGAFQQIPAGCLTCHARASRLAPPMSRMLHAIHLTGGGENVFLTVYQGECTHCHKMNPASGAWTLPSGPERPSQPVR